MTDKQIQHTIEMYHRKAMREPTKRLRAAIEQASKKRCWYNGWKHEGELADYGVLYEPMREFISEARARVRNLIESNKRRRNLVDALEEL